MLVLRFFEEYILQYQFQQHNMYVIRGKCDYIIFPVTYILYKLFLRIHTRDVQSLQNNQMFCWLFWPSILFLNISIKS